MKQSNAEGVGEYCAKKVANSFRVYLLIENLIPGLKQPWAAISERLRRKTAYQDLSHKN